MKCLILSKKFWSKSLCKRKLWNARVQVTKITLLNSNFSKIFSTNQRNFLISLIINSILNFLINAKLMLIINAKYAIILNENKSKIKSLDSRMLFVTIVTKKIIINSIVFINKKNNKCCKNRKKKTSFVNVSQAKQKKSIKTRDFIITIDWVNFLNDIRLLFELIDSKTKINFINQIYITQWKISSINVILLLLRFLNNENRYYYDAHKFIYDFVNSWKQRRQCITLFYAINYSKFDIIFEMFILID